MFIDRREKLRVEIAETEKKIAKLKQEISNLAWRLGHAKISLSNKSDEGESRFWDIYKRRKNGEKYVSIAKVYMISPSRARDIFQSAEHELEMSGIRASPTA